MTVFKLVLILCLFSVCLLSQKTITKAAKRDAIKKRQHERFMQDAKKEVHKIKDRGETITDRITKTVHSHTMKGRANDEKSNEL